LLRGLCDLYLSRIFRLLSWREFVLLFHTVELLHLLLLNGLSFKLLKIHDIRSLIQIIRYIVVILLFVVFFFKRVLFQSWGLIIRLLVTFLWLVLKGIFGTKIFHSFFKAYNRIIVAILLLICIHRILNVSWMTLHVYRTAWDILRVDKTASSSSTCINILYHSGNVIAAW
jgi:hypothetical protein